MFKLDRFIPRRRNKVPPMEIPVPQFTTVEPQRGAPGYAIAALIVVAGVCSWFYFTTGLSPHEPAAPTRPVEPTARIEPLATVPEHTCCEWVASSTRSDGTHVDGYWRSKPGCDDGCSLAKQHSEAVVSEKPAVHVGPRGGCYHFSRNGNKVYQPCK